MRKYRIIDYSTFGNRIAKRRAELHLTQKAIADKLECNESYISKVENGKAQPTLDFVLLLANALDVGVDYFLPGSAVGTQIVRAELQKEWQECSPELVLFLNRITDEAKRFEKSINSKTESE